MRAAKVQASLRIRAVSPEPPLLAHTSSESRGTFRQKARSLVLLNGRACAVKICHNGMLEDTNSLDGARMILFSQTFLLRQKLVMHDAFNASNFEKVEGAYWFGPVRGSVCPWVCPSVRACIRYTCIRSKMIRDRILKFDMWSIHEI